LEEFGYVGYRLAAGFDVAHRGTRILVPLLTNDQMQGDALLTEEGGGGVA
jgi:hypothetical protein